MKIGVFLNIRFFMLQIKPVFRCDETIKRKFCASKCLLTISVGQETHECERFSSTLDLIGRSFSSCTIALHDSLQRHTIALDEEGDADCFHMRALSLGDIWLQRNQRYIKALRIPVTIIRWDQWLNDAAFLTSKDNVLLELTHLDICFGPTLSNSSIKEVNISLN